VTWYKIKEPTREQREKADAERQKHKDEQGDESAHPAAQ
jgi:hypothetical protein